MATQKAQVTLRGRFPKGTRVRLVKVRDESVLRTDLSDKAVDDQVVGDDGSVTFSKGVEKGQRYFIVGRVEGMPVEVRVTGRAKDDPAEVLEQAPVQPDRVRLSDGSFADEAPEQEKAPALEVQPGPRQNQAGDTPQRSATPRGIATPVDPEETLPYPRQEDVPENVPQMSDTETGQATPIHSAVAIRQDEVPAGVQQRSATPVGVATPIPSGDAVAAQQEKESSEAKAARGEPVRAAAEPLEDAAKAKGRSSGEVSNDDPTEGGDTDAMGQPAEPSEEMLDPAKRSNGKSTPRRRPSSSGTGKNRSTTRKGSGSTATRATGGTRPRGKK